MTRARDLGDFIADGAAAELVVDTTTLVVDSTNNRVGIGTASPATALDVTGTVTSDGLTVVGDVTVTGDTFTITSSAQDDPVLLIQNTTNDSNSARLKFNKDRGAAAQDGDDIADIIFAGENDAQQAVTYAAVRVEAADVSDGSEDGTIAFQSMKAGTLSDSLKIDSGGDVGIGVSPSNPGWARNLQVHGAGNGGGLQLTDNTSGSGNNDGLSIASYQGNSYFINRENAFTVFSTNDTERMRISSDGTVGIGNTTSGSFSSSANNLVVGSGSGSQGMTIFGGAESNIFFSDGTSAPSIGRIEYSHIAEDMKFYVNNIQSLNITGGKVDIVGTLDIEEVIEKVTILSDTSGTINPNLLDRAITFFNVNQTANRTINFRGDGSTTLNSVMAIGQSMTHAVIMQQGSTAYYLNAYQVDGSSVTPKWQGGSAPTGGNASSIDAYSFTIIKTADATFTVLASITQYA